MCSRSLESESQQNIFSIKILIVFDIVISRLYQISCPYGNHYFALTCQEMPEKKLEETSICLQKLVFYTRGRSKTT